MIRDDLRTHAEVDVCPCATTARPVRRTESDRGHVQRRERAQVDDLQRSSVVMASAAAIADFTVGP